ncbi:MAG TPA: isoprenylcysteine carboxylmethyltransferase family protein [Candidatus Krumholzibacteria bacterium]|nr:isoprenylcysteine carboxylmethyltransferase family protein [Candidatus Krumholzibacteria bacterium]
MAFGIPLWPAVVLAVMIGQRIGELYLSSQNLPYIRAQGGREFGRAHFPLIVAVHTLFPIVFVIELLHWHTRPGPLWPLWLALFLAAQVLRYSAIVALGKRWSTRVFVLPDVPLVKGGPYRWLRHPNYVAVVIEFIAAPMLLGAWRTALCIGVLNAAVLAVRIRCENDALQRAAVDSSR